MLHDEIGTHHIAAKVGCQATRSDAGAHVARGIC